MRVYAGFAGGNLGAMDALGARGASGAALSAVAVCEGAAEVGAGGGVPAGPMVFGGAAGISDCAGAFCSEVLSSGAPLCGAEEGPPQLVTNRAETRAIAADLFMPSV